MMKPEGYEIYAAHHDYTVEEYETLTLKKAIADLAPAVAASPATDTLVAYSVYKLASGSIRVEAEWLVKKEELSV